MIRDSIDGEPTGLFRSSPIGQALGTYLPATVVFRLINFGRIALLTHWMTTQQFGLLSMILLVVNVLTPLCSLGLNEAVTRYIPQQEVGRSLMAFLRRSYALLLIVAAMSVVLIILFSSILGDFFFAYAFADETARAEFGSDAPRLARLAGLVIGLLVIYFYLLSVMKGLRMFRALAAIEMAHGLLFFCGAVGAWLSGHLSAYSLTGLYAVSLALPIIGFGWALGRVMGRWTVQRENPVDAGMRGKLLRFSIWAMLAGVMWQVLVWYPGWYLGKVHGHESFAVFSAVRQVGQFILIGAVAVTTVVMTTVTKTWESRGREAAERELSLAFRGTGLGLLVVCAVIALGKELIVRMFAADYVVGAQILPIQAMFFLIGACLAFLAIHFQLMEKTRHMFWPWAVGVAANVAIAWWLTGPSLASVQKLAVWRWLTPATSAVFTTGFSDPQGLGAASWCGVFAIGLALVVCVVLIRTECCRLDRGTYIVIASVLLLSTKAWIMTVGVVALVLLAWRTGLIFTLAERRSLVKSVGGILRYVSGARV